MRLASLFRFISILIGLLPVTLATAASGAIDVVTDGGFEAGQYGGTWTEYSVNFGTPICSVAICGSGSGTGPRSGTYWLWLGGIDNEDAWVTQTVTIPAAPWADIRFWLEISAADSAPFGPYDFFEVRMDGVLIYSTNDDDPAAGVLGYAFRTADVTSFADGGTHTLQFSGSFDAAEITNFFVDDVSLMVPEPSFSLMLSIGIGMLITLARLRGLPLVP